MHGVIGGFAAAGLIALGAAWPGAQARAEVQGVVYEVLNPEAPWGEKRRQPLPGRRLSARINAHILCAYMLPAD